MVFTNTKFIVKGCTLPPQIKDSKIVTKCHRMVLIPCSIPGDMNFSVSEVSRYSGDLLTCFVHSRTSEKAERARIWDQPDLSETMMGQ